MRMAAAADSAICCCGCSRVFFLFFVVLIAAVSLTGCSFAEAIVFVFADAAAAGTDILCLVRGIR